jgi:hypothetical protein
MSEEQQGTDEQRALLEALGAMLEDARRTQPEAFAAASNDPAGVAGWLFFAWFGICAKSPFDLKAELARYLGIIEAMQKMLDAGDGGGLLGRSPAGQTLEARLLKQAGKSTDEICRALVPGYVELTPVRQKEERGKLRDRMRQQARYAKQSSQGGKGRGRRRAPELPPTR